MIFNKPELFNGETFANDLEKNQIKITQFFDNGHNQLVIDGNEKDQAKIETLLKNHNGQGSVIVDFRASALAKLAALGLTEDEIAAL